MIDLLRIKQDLQESLSLDKHPVALLVGAGCPVSVRVQAEDGGNAPLIPDIAGLTTQVISQLDEDPAYLLLRAQFDEDERVCYTVEDLLSRIRLLRRVAGKGVARGLRQVELKDLEEKICRLVGQVVSKQLPDGDENPFCRLARWAGGAERVYPLEIFTTNYDLLVESALERYSFPYFDGFVGGIRPFFDLTAIEEDAIPSRWTRVWKLHGSVNWKLAGAKVVRSVEQGGDGDVLIHPSELKYDQSRRMPYLAMLDRLRRFIRQPSALLVTIGFSFGDEHLNELIIDGLSSNPKAACFGLLFKPLSDEVGANSLAKRAPRNLTLIARDCGLARCRVAPWLEDQRQDGETTECDLGNFVRFGEFLSALGVAKLGQGNA